MHSLLGIDILLLATKGRRTGRFRRTPLLYMESNGQYYCVASFAGSDSHPDWYLNLVAHPNVQLLVRSRQLPALAYVLSGRDRMEIWEKLVEYYPPFASYQERTERTIPVIRFDTI